MDAVEDIKQKLSVEDVVAEYVELKRSGRNLKGLSPFGNEKTPSFMVSPEKQIWHDFSSGKGGDMFTFVMEVEGLDFKEALELLARKAGVDLSKYQRNRDGTHGKKKERLYAALELAAKFYQVQFSKNQISLEYIFKKRGYTKDTALAFRIGYSPNTGNALVTFLKSKGFTQNEIRDAGLTNQRGSDMFRGRIMIPLMDATGRVIGFTARILEDNPNAPKYINTPQTAVYDKGRHVFGLHLAKDAIRKSKRAVIVEGNLDVIASYQAGVREIVATAGTAMTEMHLKELARFTTDIRLAFDADNAGINATERAIALAGKTGVSLSIIDVPEGKDPDELIKKDAKLWEQAIESNSDALDWLIRQYEKRSDLSTYGGRSEFKQAVLASVKRLQSAGEQGVYAEKVAKILGYSKEAIQDELALIRENRKTYKSVHIRPQEVDKNRIEHKKIQDHLLALALAQPALREYLQPLTDEMLLDDDARKTHTLLVNEPMADTRQPGVMQKFGEYGKILLLQFEELYQGLEILELRYEAARLQARLIGHYVKMKKHQIASELAMADEATTATLLGEVKELDNLLHTYKGEVHAEEESS